MTASAEPAEQEGERGGEGDIAPKIPTKRPPYAEEVGPPAGSEERITPLPGLPVDSSFDSATWIPEGPAFTKSGDANIAPLHPTSGCVTAVAPHPSDQNTVYIGTANGGVWKTTNALSPNVRWKPLTDDQLSLSIGGLAFDPNDATGNTLVAGFGRRSSYGGAGGAHKGLLRTTDGGTTWSRIGEVDLANRSIYQIAVRGSTFLLAVPSADPSPAPAPSPGLYRTTNGGTSFTNMSGAVGANLPVGAVTHLAADPSNLSRFYVHVANVGVFRSSDSGATWTNISANLAVANLGQVALTVAFDGTVFAAQLAGTSSVYRSTNLGVNWTQMDSVQANTGGTFNGFVADPGNSNLVYISGLYIRCCFPFSGRVVRGNAALPAGTQWTSIASTQLQPGGAPCGPPCNATAAGGTAPHTDSRALAFTAGNRLIEGDDGGIYELNIANVGTEGDGLNGGGTWRSLNGNLQITEMHSMAYDALSRIFIGGAQDTAFQEQLAPGVSQAGMAGWQNTSNGDGGEAAVDLLTSSGQSIRYGSSQNLAGFFRAVYNANNVQQSRNFPAATLVGGGTPINSGTMPFTAPVTMNAVAGGRLIIGGNFVTYESTDQGSTVSQLTNVPVNGLSKVAYGGRLNGANVPDVLFYGSGATVRYRTTTGGAISSLAFPGGNVQGVALDPENWKAAWIVGSTAVYSANDIATNGAGGFTNITGNLTGVGTFQTIEYLTLPSGDAIMVGTDLGAYIMRLSAPGVWKTLGDNLPHASVYASHFDKAGQVLAITVFGRGAWLYDFKSTKATGQYGETFQGFTEGGSTFPAAVGELFSSQLGTATQVVDANLRELRLTVDGTGGTFTAFRLPDLNPGRATPAFSAKWNGEIYGAAAGLADGFSFNFGPLGGITPAAFTDGTYTNEDGFNAGLTVSVRTFSGNAPGYYVRVNGTVVPGGFVSKPSANWGDFNTARHFFDIDWRMDTGLTLRVDGVAIFTNLATPGFTPGVGDRFVFGARTGGSDQTTTVDNLAIVTGGVLSRVAGIAPYYFSADFPSAGQTADKAFDGNPNTKWLAQDYTGFIGASFGSAKTVRVYTLTASEDVPGRDLAAWDFQTGNDGVLWTQHGAQGAQFFQNRGEQRAFVVANPAANSKFRVHISENHEAPEIQLSEFQPWELIQVPASFVVTTNNDAGAGSLRQTLADAALFASPSKITFAPALAGQTITLANEITISNPDGVTIDASALTAGLTIDGGPGTNRILSVNSGTATLTALTLTGGNAAGAISNGNGGAIYNLGTLNLNRCTISGNNANGGGAVVGGAILSFGTVTLTQCTMSGNSTTGFGGALANYGAATLTHSTVSGNNAAANGGGIDNGNGATITLTLNNSIVAGNTAGVGNDINNFNGNVTRVGANIVQGYAGVAATGSGTISNANPLLAPLDNYGGTTRTMALKPTSPARNASVGSAITSDQRAFPIVNIADIGAYEAGTLTNFNAFIWETLPASATVADHAAGFDFDGDGATNFNEWLALTNAGDSASLFRATNIVRSGANVNVTFTTVVGRNYTSEFSTDLVAWTPLVGTAAGTGNPITVAIGPVSGFNTFFVRVRTGP